MRRALIHHTSSAGISEAGPLIRAFAGRLAKDLLLEAGADGFNEALHTWAYDIALAVLYGKTTESMGSGWMLEYREAHRCFLKIIEPGVAQLAGIFPVVGWLPDWLAGGWRGDAERARRGFEGAYGRLAREAKKGVGGKGGYESLVARHYRESEEKMKAGSKEARLSERDIELIAGSTLDAAAGTVLSAMLFLVQAMAKYPEVQRRAQAEIDELWTRDGIPVEFEIAKLPYVSACVLEILRWRPPIPLSVPRMCLTDQTVDGYHIPAGTTVVTNVWAIQHDEGAYDRPDVFEPERFLRNPLGTKGSGDGNGGSNGRKQPLQAFGVGRRACPGDQLALYQLRVTIAVLLWGYDIVAEGELDCSPETGMLEGLAVTPSPFKVKFVPRDEEVRQRLLDEYQGANEMLASLLG